MKQCYAMGTFLSVHIRGENSSALEKIFIEEVQHLEDRLSKYRPESEVSCINQAAGQHPVAVSPNTYYVVEEAVRYAERSGGAFDPTLQPFGFRHVQLDREAQTVFLTHGGIILDLGGIGKGYALDKALASVLLKGTPESISADFGGQLLFWHEKGSFEPQTIHIENPITRDIHKTFQITSNCSIATSSNAERPGHLRNPLTGLAGSSTESVTVIARSGIEAEGLSTTFFVQGRFGLHNLS